MNAAERIQAGALANPARNDTALFTAVRALGLTIRKREGEYRITVPGLPPARAEAVAAYTNDRADAWGTAQFMAAEFNLA